MLSRSSARGRRFWTALHIPALFALNAGIAGAQSVLGVDASETAVLQARRNASLNGLDGTVKFLCEDVFELLPELEEKGEKFDVVVLDPPAFTKSRSSVKNAIKGIP